MRLGPAIAYTLTYGQEFPKTPFGLSPEEVFGSHYCFCFKSELLLIPGIDPASVKMLTMLKAR